MTSADLDHLRVRIRWAKQWPWFLAAHGVVVVALMGLSAAHIRRWVHTGPGPELLLPAAAMLGVLGIGAVCARLAFRPERSVRMVMWWRASLWCYLPWLVVPIGAFVCDLAFRRLGGGGGNWFAWMELLWVALLLTVPAAGLGAMIAGLGLAERAGLERTGHIAIVFGGFGLLASGLSGCFGFFLWAAIFADV